MRRFLATLSVSLACAASARADAPALLLPPSLGRPEVVWISGRVLEEAKGRSGPPAFRTARALSAENWEGAPVEVTFLGRTARATSGHDGEFEVEIAAAPGAPFPAGAQRATVRVPGASAKAAVMVVSPEAPFLLVSDFDDTVAVTNVTSRRGVLESTFLKDAHTQPVVPGMAALYRCLADGHPAPPPLAIVSGSPVQLAPRVERFLARNGFRPAALFLRNLGPGTLSGYKEPVLARLAERFPQPFVLVGDSGERDPEIYASFARAHPGRVLAAYLRQATPSPGPPERFAGLVLFAEPAAAARDAARRGLAAAPCVEAAFPPAAAAGGAAVPSP
jgi:phosphatidate phosphatase APP1